MPNYMGDLIRGLADLFPQPQPTPPPINTGMPQMPQMPNVPQPMNQAIPQINGMPGMPIPNQGMNMGDPGIFDEYLESARHPPEYERPTLMRSLGTALYSALRTNPDKVTESYDKEGRMSKVVQKGGHTYLSPEEVDYYLNLPNRTHLADWQRKNASLKDATNVEIQHENYRSLQNNRLSTQELARTKEGRLQTDSDIKNLTSQQKIALAQSKQALDQWKAQNPRGQVIMPRGGNVTIVNPISGEATDTGIPTGLMSEEDRIRLTGNIRSDQIAQQGANQLAGIEATGNNQLDNIAATGANQQNNILTTGEQNRETKATPPGANPNANVTGQLPTQQIKGQQLRANMAIMQHPTWRQWIQIDPNTGMVNVAPASQPGQIWGNTNGPTKEERDLIISYITGVDPSRIATPINQLPPSQVNPQNQNILATPPPPQYGPRVDQVPPTTPPKVVSQVPKGYVVVSNGVDKKVVPEGNVAAFLADPLNKGYKVEK